MSDTDVVVAGSEPTLTITVYQDKAKTAPRDLTGHVVLFRFQIDGSTPVIEGSCTITDAPNGVCTYLFTPGQLVAGELVGQVKATVGGKPNSGPERINIEVAPPLGA